jgi:hypothetical protein
MNKYLVAIVSILVLTVSMWYFYYAQSPASPIEEISVTHEGVVIKDNPGFKPGVWFLSYDEPGSPGLSVELDLDSVPSQYTSLTQGDRVRVEGILRGSVVKVNSIAKLSSETGMSIDLYFYNPERDQGPGGVQCSSNGLVSVQRIIPQTTTPLADTLELLLRGEISDEEQALGIESEFPLSGLTLVNATIIDGVATLTFEDPQNKTVGGSCRTGILWAQIEATAQQFPTVESVRFMPEELFQP